MQDAILITGGLGFIASSVTRAVVEAFPDRGVIVLDALTYAGYLENLPEELHHADPDRFQLVTGNICDRELVQKVMRSCSTVVHLAAESHVAGSLAQADKFMETNVFGTTVLAEESLKVGVERFIHISTSEVYGTADYAPMDEVHPLKPRSPYAASKAGAEHVIGSYYYSYGLPSVILRPFNNYGPRQHAEKVIPCFITSLLDNQPIEVMDGGGQSRDWIYAPETARAIVAACKADMDTLNGEVINVASCEEYSISDIADMLIDMLGKPTDLKRFTGTRPGQVQRHCALADKARDLLGFENQMPFKQGLEKTVEWYIQNIDQVRRQTKPTLSVYSARGMRGRGAK